MKTILALETSTQDYSAAIHRNGVCLAELALDKPGIEQKNVDRLIRLVLKQAGLAPAGLDGIFVDAGPGNLSSVRAGVAYANALGFSLGIPVTGVCSFRLLAAQARGGQAERGLPLLGTRRAAGGNIYAAMLDGDRLKLFHGTLAESLKVLAGVDGLKADGRRVCVAGTEREEACVLLGPDRTIDSGINFPGIAAFPLLFAQNPALLEATGDGLACPITEQNLEAA